MRATFTCDSTDPLNASTQTLLVALVALAGGPLVYALSRPIRWAFAALDGFVLTAVGALVVLHVLPRALTAGGILALAAVLLGLATPLILHKLELGRRRSDAWVIGIGLLGLAAHSAMDGAGLVASDHALSWAIVLHRIPAGLFVWWLVRPAYGVKTAAAVLVGTGVATIFGFYFFSSVAVEPGIGLASFEAFVGGALLHVLASHHPDLHGHAPHAHSHTAELGGAALGVLLVTLLPEAPHHDAHELDHYGERFLRIAMSVAPWVIGGYSISGLVAAFAPRVAVRGGAVAQLLRGLGMTLSSPVLSCGVRTKYAQMVDGGAPTIGAVAFLVLAPAIGIEALMISIPFLGPYGTIVRIVAALAVAVAVVLMVGRRSASFDDGPPAPNRLRAGLSYGFVELVDHTIGWIVFGVALKALLEPGRLDTIVAGLPTWAWVPVLAMVSVPFYICATGATPMAAALIASGFSLGGGLAFLIAGAPTSITTFRTFSRLHGRMAAIRFGLTVVVVAALCGWGVNALEIPSGSVPVAPGPVQMISAGLLVVLLAASLVRRGLRHFLLSVLRAEHH